MAESCSRTVVTPTLPEAALTAADRLLLSLLFESEAGRDGERTYFASAGIAFEGERDAGHLAGAVAQSPPCLARTILEGALASGGSTVPIDLSGAWEKLLQDIVGRSADLTHIVVITAYAGSTMDPDGIGGAATVITADRIDSVSTFEFVDAILRELGIET